MATPDLGGGSQEGGRGPEAQGLRPLSLRVFFPTPGLWKMAAHPTAGPSADSTHPILLILPPQHFHFYPVMDAFYGTFDSAPVD